MKAHYPATLADVIERSLSGGRESEELIAVTLLLCLCRSSFIRLKGLKQAARAHLLLHIKPSLSPCLIYMIGNTCIVACYADLEMETCPIKSPSFADQRKYGSRRRRVKPRRFKPLLNCLNSLPPSLSPRRFEMNTNSHSRVVCPVRKHWGGGGRVCDVSA